MKNKAPAGTLSAIGFPLHEKGKALMLARSQRNTRGWAQIRYIRDHKTPAIPQQMP